MTYNVELLKVDIRDELGKLDQLAQEYAGILDKIDLPPEQVAYYDRGAVGYILHNFYNGCENIFQSIARFFENDLGSQSWHRDLLKRMRLEIPGFRPRVIDDELFRLLDDFRGFRHKFWQSYSFELDWEKERLVARKLPKTLQVLKSQIEAFLTKLNELQDA